MTRSILSVLLKNMLRLALVFAIYAYVAYSAPLPAGFGPINSETPPFTVISRGADYEVRRYQPQLWAQVDYTIDPSIDPNRQSSLGFQYLFQYITGNNDRAQKIPMTAPVVNQQLSGGANQRRMAFIMPGSLFSRLDALPKPNDPKVQLVAVNEPLVFACITFNMNLNQDLIATKEAELRRAVAADKIAVVQEPEAVRVEAYNAPYVPPEIRTNDICIPLVNQA